MITKEVSGKVGEVSWPLLVIIRTVDPRRFSNQIGAFVVTASTTVLLAMNRQSKILASDLLDPGQWGQPKLL